MRCCGPPMTRTTLSTGSRRTCGSRTGVQRALTGSAGSAFAAELHCSAHQPAVCSSEFAVELHSRHLSHPPHPLPGPQTLLMLQHTCRVPGGHQAVRGARRGRHAASGLHQCQERRARGPPPAHRAVPLPGLGASGEAAGEGLKWERDSQQGRKNVQQDGLVVACSSRGRGRCAEGTCSSILHVLVILPLPAV